MVEPLRHRQTKGAETDMPGLPLPRHIPTLPNSAVRTGLPLTSGLHPIPAVRMPTGEGVKSTLTSRSLRLATSADCNRKRTIRCRG